MNNKTSKVWKNVQFTIQLIVLGIFLPPCIYNWFYIPMMWGKVSEFWGIVFTGLGISF